MSHHLIPPPKFPGAQAPFHPQKGFPNWEHILTQSEMDWTKREDTVKGVKVVIGSNTGMHGAVSTFDSILSCALSLAGANVSRMFCDGAMPACLIPVYGQATPPEMLIKHQLTKRLCKACFNRGTHTHRPLGLPELRFSEFLTPEDYKNAETIAASVPVSSIPSWSLDNIAVGEHAYAGALRYFAKGDIEDEVDGNAVLLRYLEGAILTKLAYERMIKKCSPDVVVLHHGIYSPQGVAADVCRKSGVRVVTWVVAYRKSCFIFSHDDTYHHTMMTEDTKAWENLNLSELQEEELFGYLASRSKGDLDWIYFHKEPSSDFITYAKTKGIDTTKPLVTILTNVMWDAQLHYPANAFKGMKEWIIGTVDYFINRPDLEIVVRIHPAEVRGSIKSRQKVGDILKETYPELPKNIHIVYPDEEASTYALTGASNAVIIYGTKMGTELAPLGKPIIVGGEAWIRNKGITQDATTPENYYQILDTLPYQEGEFIPDKDRSRNYAYHFFFRRMIPLPFLEPNGTGAMFDLNVRDISSLKPGKYPGLDTIINGIMNGSPFIYEAENYGN